MSTIYFETLEKRIDTYNTLEELENLQVEHYVRWKDFYKSCPNSSVNLSYKLFSLQIQEKIDKIKTP